MYIKILLSGLIGFSLIFNIIKCQETCMIKEDTPGTCKLLRDCPEVIDKVRRRMKDYKICSYDPLTVCCSGSESNPVQLSSQSNENGQECPKRRIHEDKCTEYAEAVYVYEKSKALIRQDDIIKTDKCGNKNIPLIVGGENAGVREFPHMALIGYLCKGKKEWKCAGSLISDQYILTAGHCLSTPSCGEAAYVRLGELDLSNDEDDADPEDFDVIERIPHPFYSDASKYHDIALIKLDRKVNINPYKRPACLPSTFDGPESTVIVTGWGRTKYLGGRSSELQKVVLDKFNRSECNEIYTQIPNELLKVGIDEKIQLCAGSFNEKKDACQGDSGGPMQVYHHSEYCMYTIIGITSFGILCGNPGIPGVYTRVFPYNSWIENTVWG
ncbi:venom protease-like [Condylostylus longicornis]|uniref:venom protease-like n=1 Tax=Condylostylus longicornis TaxID=2530218 RepID=UPI00244E10F9|nr:venom protease-like [Condylostylus longicornis]